jgi:hypothetical protein
MVEVEDANALIHGLELYAATITMMTLGTMVLAWVMHLTMHLITAFTDFVLRSAVRILIA